MTVADDPHDLNRFVEAQAVIFPTVLRELEAGRKASHWMWFVFPQLEGLGHSPMAQRYAIRSLDEARAYVADPVLGPRLRRCTALVNAIAGSSITAILSSPDDLKFRSCVTLFAQATADDAVFREALTRFFAGRPDTATLERIGR